MSWSTKKEKKNYKSLLDKIKVYDKDGNDIYSKLNIKVTDSEGNVLIDDIFGNGSVYEMIDYYLGED